MKNIFAFHFPGKGNFISIWEWHISTRVENLENKTGKFCRKSKVKKLLLPSPSPASPAFQYMKSF